MILFAALSFASVSEDVERWVDAAGGDGFMPTDWAAGMERLERMGSQAIPPLISALSTRTEANELHFVCGALERMPDPRARSPLAARLGHQDWLVRSACGSAFGATLALEPLRSTDLQRLLKIVLNDENCSVRRNTALAARSLQDLQLRSLMESRLESRDPCDKEVALTWLAGAQTDTDALGGSFLKIAIDTGQPNGVREVAVTGVGLLGYAAAREPMIALIKSEPPGNLKALAVEALGRVGTRDDIAFLEGVRAADKYGRDGYVGHKVAEAIQALRAR